jgi:hypothetical protein
MVLCIDMLVGSLNYLTTTRLDIAYSVSILSQFMAKPHDNHWKEAKRVIQYLKGTVDFGIEYTNHLNVELIGYSDSDWTGDPDDRKSTTGYAFSIGSGLCLGATRSNQLFPCPQLKLSIKHCAVLPMKQFG